MGELAIVGGGIVGLALALNLHARGVRRRIFESSPEIRELGVGITLLPHAVRDPGKPPRLIGLARRRRLTRPATSPMSAAAERSHGERPWTPR